MPATALLALLACAGPARALSVQVTDPEKRPVAAAVVFAIPRSSKPEKPAGRRHAVMDQINRQFQPRVLVIPTGTTVDFPNSDSVSHHVYSFSDTKRFDLPLYRGSAHPPINFDSAGVVVVGCNIHDSMLGYIVVVDTPYFGLTDERGVADLGALPPDEYEVRVWSDRSREQETPRRVRIDSAAQPPSITFSFSSKLFPAHQAEADSLAWSEY